jgi:ABC-type Fe3+ transport system substrate-binding protein
MSLYGPDGHEIPTASHAKNQFLIDTMQQGMMYLAFSTLVVSRMHGWDSAKHYLEKVYAKLTHSYPEYFIMLRKIENNEWEESYRNWLGVENEPKAKS